MPEMKEKYVQLDEVIAKHKGTPGALMPVLQEAQNIFGYVPMDVQQIIADVIEGANHFFFLHRATPAFSRCARSFWRVRYRVDFTLPSAI